MTKEQYKYFPQTKDELRSLIKNMLKIKKLNKASFLCYNKNGDNNENRNS